MHPQLDWIGNPDCASYPDFIGHIETISEDIKHVDEKLNIPSTKLEHKNKSIRKETQEYYSPREQELVYKAYRKDFEVLGYSENLDSLNPLKGAGRTHG